MQNQMIPSIVLLALFLSIVYMLMSDKTLRDKVPFLRESTNAFRKLAIGFVAFLIVVIGVAWILVANSNM